MHVDTISRQSNECSFGPPMLDELGHYDDIVGPRWRFVRSVGVHEPQVSYRRTLVGNVSILAFAKTDYCDPPTNGLLRAARPVKGGYPFITNFRNRANSAGSLLLHMLYGPYLAHSSAVKTKT